MRRKKLLRTQGKRSLKRKGGASARPLFDVKIMPLFIQLPLLGKLGGLLVHRQRSFISPAGDAHRGEIKRLF